MTFVRQSGWLRRCFKLLITPLGIDGIGQNWEDSNIALFPILSDAVDVKRGDQLCKTGSQPSIQPDKVVRPMGS